MQKGILSLAIFLIVFLFGLPSDSFAGQFIPNPGLNCGLAYPSQIGEDANAIPNLSQTESSSKYACCYSDAFVTLEKYSDSLKATANIPLIGPAIAGMLNIFDPLEFPRSIILDPRVPRLGDFKSLADENDAQSLCPLGGIPTGDVKSNQCYCKKSNSPVLQSIMKLCGNIEKVEERKQCVSCLGYDTATQTFKEGGIWTSIGCVKPSLTSFIQETVFGLGIGFAGIVSLGCIIYASILLQFSQGDPEKVQAARDMIQSCIFGLILIIFSVFILRVIGVDILRIPGFS